MLYLTRKLGESIIINNNIELIITEIKGSHVQLGFKYSDGSVILRKELYEKISQSNKLSSLSKQVENLPDLDLLLKKKK